jgi:hypothetical protein
MERLHFVCQPPNFDANLPQLRANDKSTDEGRALRKSLNDATKAHVTTLLGSAPHYEFWSDATVVFPETPKCTAAGYSALWDTATGSILCEWAGSAGRLACSYTAEAHTARAGLHQATLTLLQIHTPSTLMLGFDNMGLTMALATGPVRATTQPLASIWSDLELLLARGWKIAVCFYFSHVGTELNEHVDKGAERALAACTPADHDQAPIDLDDMTRAVQLFLTQRWHETNKSLFRVAAFGPRPINLTELASFPNYTEILRARADCSPHYGKLHRIINPTEPAECRLCKKLPPDKIAQPRAATIAAAAAAAAAAAPVAAAAAAAAAPPPAAHLPRPPDELQCPQCPKRLTNKTNLLRHMRRIHPEVAPEEGDNYQCECKRSFASFASRRVHRQSCQAYQATYGAANQAAVAETAADIDTIESFSHFWTGQCTGFPPGPKKVTPASLSRYVADLLDRLGPSQ